MDFFQKKNSCIMKHLFQNTKPIFIDDFHGNEN